MMIQNKQDNNQKKEKLNNILNQEANKTQTKSKNQKQT